MVKAKKIVAGVDLQLPFSPQLVTAFRVVDLGSLGKLQSVEYFRQVYMPWQNWPFVFDESRIELTLHSVHYRAVALAFLGHPATLRCRVTNNHPHDKLNEDVASDTTLIYDRDGEPLANYIHCQQIFNGDRDWWQSEYRLVCERGRVVARVWDDFPEISRDSVQIHCFAQGKKEPVAIPLRGNRFPEALLGTMNATQAAAVLTARSGAVHQPPIDMHFAVAMSGITEACYHSAERGGVESVRDAEMVQRHKSLSARVLWPQGRPNLG